MWDKKSFFQYVLECLECEVDSQVKSSFYSSTADDRTYAFLKAFPGKLKGINRFVYLFNDEKIREILDKASPEQGKTQNRRIVIGYPTITMKIKKHRYIFPIVYWRVINAAEGLCKGPYIHSDFIAAFTRYCPNLTFTEYLKENGISVDLEDWESVATMVSDLCKLPVAKDWRVQSLDPRFPEYDDAISVSYSTTRVLNRIIVAASEGPSYTAGLIEEIKEIEKRSWEEINSTALGTFLDCLLNDKTIDPSQAFEKPILEDGRSLNADQRNAVRQALTSQVTLIQGPPGTGKTQVVKNLYLNALLQNQKVLFTSKNTAAVEAVTGIDLSKEPLTLTQVKKEENNQKSPPVLQLLDDKINRIHNFLQEADCGPANIGQTYTKMGRLQQQRVEVETKARALHSVLAELKTYQNSHEAFIEAIPNASVVKGKERLYRSLISMISGVNVLLDQYEQETKKPFSLRRFLLSALSMYFMRKRLLRELNKLSPYMKKAGLDDEVLSYWEATPDLVKEELEDQQTLLGKYPEFKKYEELSDKLQSMGTFFEIDKALYGIDQQSVSLSENIIENLSVLHKEKFSHQSLMEWKRLCCNPVHHEKALIKALEMVRCIAVKTLSVRGRVPLKPGIFDLTIVDEAGQIDVFSLIPILFRTKRIAVIGDPKQLSPIIKLERRIYEQIQQRYISVGKLWPYTDRLSFYELALRVCPCGETLLREHYRCHPDISSFVSSHFYGNHLIDAMMTEPNKPVSERAGIFWEDVDCDDDLSTDLVSVNEVTQVVQWVLRLVNEYGLEPHEIGVITPFTEQTKLIKESLKNENLSEVLVSTAHGFQGGERRVIIYSVCLRRHLRKTGMNFLDRGTNLFNVAVTRAKEQLIVVGDKEFALSSKLTLYREFASYVESLAPNLAKRCRIGVSDTVSALEMDLANVFQEEGIAFEQQVPVDRYVLDFAITVGKYRLNLEVDGEQFHMTSTGNLRYYDRMRNQYLIAKGWDVKRYWAREVKNNPKKIVTYVRSWIENKKREEYVAVETN